jgi:hypothetical protein
MRMGFVGRGMSDCRTGMAEQNTKWPTTFAALISSRDICHSFPSIAPILVW